MYFQLMETLSEIHDGDEFCTFSADDWSGGNRYACAIALDQYEVWVQALENTLRSQLGYTTTLIFEIKIQPNL